MGIGKKAFEQTAAGCGGIGSATGTGFPRPACGPSASNTEIISADRGGSEDHCASYASYHDRAYTTLTPSPPLGLVRDRDESGIRLVFETCCSTWNPWRTSLGEHQPLRRRDGGGVHPLRGTLRTRVGNGPLLSSPRRERARRLPTRAASWTRAKPTPYT